MEWEIKVMRGWGWKRSQWIDEGRRGEERSIGEEKSKRSEEKVVLNDEGSINPGRVSTFQLVRYDGGSQ